jgi:hypothetical protein
MLPVPLNSWKITSSIRLPVSTRRGDDGERAGLFGLAGRGEELAGLFQGADIETAGAGAAGVAGVLWARERRVIESRKSTTSRPASTNRLARSIARSAMRTWLSICSSLDEAQISAGHAALEVGDFLRALVDEQDHHMALRIVFDHAERHVAQQGGLAGAGRGDDQAAGAFADGAEQIDRAGRQRPSFISIFSC